MVQVLMRTGNILNTHLVSSSKGNIHLRIPTFLSFIKFSADHTTQLLCEEFILGVPTTCMTKVTACFFRTFHRADITMLSISREAKKACNISTTLSSFKKQFKHHLCKPNCRLDVFHRKSMALLIFCCQFWVICSMVLLNSRQGLVPVPKFKGGLHDGAPLLMCLHFMNCYSKRGLVCKLSTMLSLGQPNSTCTYLLLTFQKEVSLPYWAKAPLPLIILTLLSLK